MNCAYFHRPFIGTCMQMKRPLKLAQLELFTAQRNKPISVHLSSRTCRLLAARRNFIHFVKRNRTSVHRQLGTFRRDTMKIFQFVRQMAFRCSRSTTKGPRADDWANIEPESDFLRYCPKRAKQRRWVCVTSPHPPPPPSSVLVLFCCTAARIRTRP